MQAAAGDAVIATLQGRGLRQAPDAMLRDRIRRAARTHALRRDRADVDNAADTLRLHDSQRGAGAQEGASQVDRHHLFPRGQRQFVERPAIEGSGVIDQHVEPAEPLQDRAEQRLDRGLVGHIGGPGQYVGAKAIDFGGSCLEQVCLPRG